MTFSSLTIKDAEAIAKKAHAEGCIIICIDKQSQLKGVSFGDTAFNCRLYGKMLDSLVDRIEGGEV